MRIIRKIVDPLYNKGQTCLAIWLGSSMFFGLIFTEMVDFGWIHKEKYDHNNEWMLLMIFLGGVLTWLLCWGEDKKEARNGVWSIVQYKPNAVRDEAANIGVVLFCSKNIPQMQIKTGLSRAKQMFNLGVEELADIEISLEVVTKRLNACETLYDVKRYITKLSELKSNVVLTDLRYACGHIKSYQDKCGCTYKSGDTIDQLFNKLVA